jgi:hypothetical protein
MLPNCDYTVFSITSHAIFGKLFEKFPLLVGSADKSVRFLFCPVYRDQRRLPDATQFDGALSFSRVFLHSIPMKKSVPAEKRRIEPITCPDCGGQADLMRRTLHPKIKCEIRTFECRQCGKQSEKSTFHP